ncbi:MAG: PcfJ domain-containing protein [Firmicutes bacterium]|nr:PcfJ domain-containing protein [Bacillota bacterium]
MKIEKIKPIPKYILARIKKADIQNNNVTLPHRTRFYAYLTKNDGELVKVTVAVKYRYKKWLYKQVAVHGVHSDLCFVKDMVFYNIWGYFVGWYEQGAQKAPRWYERAAWDIAYDKYFDPQATIVNREFLNKFSEYKYSAVERYTGVKIFEYLRLYETYPQIEYLMKAGLDDYVFSKQILQKIGKNKSFAKWLMKNRTELTENKYYVDVILRAFKTGRALPELQMLRKSRLELLKSENTAELRDFFKNDLEKLILYLDKQQISVYSYKDYFDACRYLNLDMAIEKNRYPRDFKRWHDIRIDEYATAKAVQDEKERKAFYDTFAAVANKYSGLEYDNKSVYIAVIAQSPAELIREGELLNHCVGRMGYDRKFAREESLIFFIRTKEQPDVPFVTVEYSPSRKQILQCYAYHDSTPDDGVLQFVNLTWLPYANKKLRKIQRSAA